MDAYLVYDADCRLCALARAIAALLDWRGRLTAVPLRDPRSQALLAAIDEHERAAAFHVVSDGGTASGGAGLIAVAGLLPLGRGIPKLAGEMSLLRQACDRAYAFLASLRIALACAR